MFNHKEVSVINRNTNEQTSNKFETSLKDVISRTSKTLGSYPLDMMKGEVRHILHPPNVDDVHNHDKVNNRQLHSEDIDEEDMNTNGKRATYPHLIIRKYP